MFNPAEVIGNPDQPNIYNSASTRPDRGEDKYRKFLEPLVESLKRERENFPFTVIFGNLEKISSCYSFFSHSMGNDQYTPKGALHKAENRLFTQFHAQYPLKEKERIIDGLMKGTSKLRLVSATVAFDVRLDLDFTRKVIHIGVPYTMEESSQELWLWLTSQAVCKLFLVFLCQPLCFPKATRNIKNKNLSNSR